MKQLLCNSAYFGILLSLGSYYLGVRLQRRFRSPLCNPLLISTVICIAVLSLSGIDYEVYNASAQHLSYLLTPATVCLAIPLYRQLSLLKGNSRAILLGVLSGVLASLGCVLVLALVFGLSHAQYVTFLPKSVTSAIGMALAEELGGYPDIAMATIIVTGILGNIFAEGFLRLMRVNHPIAKGVAIGTAAHAFGTSRAMEMGETEGAMSSLSIVVAGVMTVVGASVFAQFI